MARKRLSVRKRFRKWLDGALDNSFAMQFAVLILLTVVILAVGTILGNLLPNVRGAADAPSLSQGIRNAAWWTWMRVTNPGMLPEDQEFGVLQITLSTIIILCGWVVFGLLISILTTAFQERLEQIKRGATEVFAADHTVVLGWNSTVFSVIDQLGSGDEAVSGEVVVLADLEVDAMREEAAKYCKPEGLKSVDFRRGSVASVKSILDMKIRDARQVIILGSDSRGEGEPGAGGVGEGRADLQDSPVLKALLACFQAVSGEGSAGGDRQKLPIVASVASAESARIIESGVPRSVSDLIAVHVVHTADLLSRLTAQTANQPALARVYKELFSYEGSIVDGVDISSEIYVVDVDERMLGVSFEDSLLGYGRAIPIGYAGSEGPVVNPLPGTPGAAHRFEKGDRIVAVADTLEDIVWTGKKDLPAQEFTPAEAKPEPRNVLVIGDGTKPRKVLGYLPGFLPPGSRIAATQPAEGIDLGSCTFEVFQLRPSAGKDAGKDAGSRVASGSSPEAARRGGGVPVGDAELHAYDSIVLADDISDPDRHDAKVLMDLTALHARLEGDAIKASVIVELLDSRNLALARAFGDMAAIISSELVSNFLVQLAVEPVRGQVFRELLDPEGSEMYVRPVARYVKGGGEGDEKLSFDDIFARARTLGEIAVGYIPPGQAPIQLCPRERTAPKPAADFGQIVVVAED